jgi:nicotinamidase-related amidase
LWVVPRRALVVIDMINRYDFEGAEVLKRNAEAILPTLRGLLERAREADAPVIYVNDNFGDWRLDHIEPLVPDERAMFVLKPRHSIFFETPLSYLLHQEEIDELVLTGQATEQCIVYSALDAHIRHIPVMVPRDAVAHIHEDLAQAALRMMEINMEATVCDAEDVEF